MIIESDPERSHRRECGLAQLAEHERSNEITAPMSLDLEILPLNYQLPRYFVPTNCTDFAEQLCPSLTYGIDCDSCSLLDSIKESNNASVIKRADPSNFHQIENEGMHEESQLTMGHHSKKKRTYNRKRFFFLGQCLQYNSHNFDYWNNLHNHQFDVKKTTT